MQIGEVTVYPLLDGVIPVPAAVLYPEVAAWTWRTLSAMVDEQGQLQVPFGGFLAVDEQGHRVVFDLGGGHAPELLPDGQLPAVCELLPTCLDDVGCPPDSVTDVIFSHLHVDHIGWATTDAGPTFPHARHHVHAHDWQHFILGGADDAVRQKIAPLGEAVELWDGDGVRVYDWLRLVHAPGHTPGASVALIESGGQSLALIGDLFHHPVAADHPHWRCGFDWNDTVAAATRHKWADILRETRTPLVGPHFPDLEPVTIS
jgi:glyoxylase-like metal-dependent hydrolase (beta-lactamase superfamily II)